MSFFIHCCLLENVLLHSLLEDTSPLLIYWINHDHCGDVVTNSKKQFYFLLKEMPCSDTSSNIMKIHVVGASSILKIALLSGESDYSPWRAISPRSAITLPREQVISCYHTVTFY
jgi:hypothetical protein